MNKNRLLVCTALVGVSLLGACASPNTSGVVYNANEAKREQIVRMGVVESIREVSIQREASPIGALAGGVVGGLAGSNVGRGKGSDIGAVLGAVAGGLAGNAIEGSAGLKKGYEITVRLESGELRAYVQEADEVFKPGERVRLVSTGGAVRVTH